LGQARLGLCLLTRLGEDNYMLKRKKTGSRKNNPERVGQWVASLAACSLLLFWGIYLATFIINRQIKRINSFEECASKYRVYENYPAECLTPDHRLFIETVAKPSAKPPATISEAEVDKMILDIGHGMASPEITAVTVGEKLFYTDRLGTVWLKYSILPVPENAADPATGIAKKEAGHEWQNLDFGTAGLGNSLPLNVQKALNLDSTDQTNY